MMKKLLVLLSVLALATAANAAILELSVDGQVNGPGVPDEIFINPSDEVVIDVYCSEADADAFWLNLEGPGEFLNHPGTVYAAAPGGMIATDYGYGPTWVYAYIDAPDPTDLGEVGVWYDVIFHCTGPEDVTITLYDAGGVTPVDSLVIHQPEPMTIALLGLGGLFLRRRK